MSGYSESMKSSGGSDSAKSAPVAGAVGVTGNRYIDALTWGTKWDNSVAVTYTFSDDQRPWTEYERQAFYKAMATYESVIDIHFAFVADAEDANLVFHSVGDGTLRGALGMQAGPHGGGDDGQGYYNWQGDGWNPDGLEKGGYAYNTIVHELGHAIGLAHPHDEGGGSPVFPRVKHAFSKGKFALNQGLYTVMSYNDLNMKWSPDHPEAGYGFIAGPMAFDIAALQNIYGANNDFNTGDDVYQLPDFNHGGIFYAAIWDTSGIDALNFDGARPCTIDLRPAPLEGRHAGGYLSSAKKIYGGVTIANGVTIENASGGSSRDRIYGNDVANNLEGNEGADRIYGFFGNDTLDGGAGRDTMAGGPGDDVYHVDHPRDKVKEGKDGGFDTVYSSSSYNLSHWYVENLTLTASADDDVNATGNLLDNVLTGNDGDNRLNGKKGVDTMTGGAGDDTYVVNNENDMIVEAPGEGIDSVEATFDYVLAPDLENLTLKGPYARNGTGNDANNVLTGNGRANQFTGGLGNDTIGGGRGTDTAFYAGDYGDFTVAIGADVISVTDLNAGDGDEGADALTKVEFLRFGDGLYEGFSGVFIPDGTEGNDSIVGSDFGNTLIGLAGDDTLSGGGGNDTLDGGDGNDSLVGGAGKDVMTGGAGDDVYEIDNGYDRVHEDAGGGADTVIGEKSIMLSANVENAIRTGIEKGSIGGNGLDNVLTGGSGKNTIRGRDGADTIAGGDDKDYLSGGDGADSISAGDGDDKIYGDDGDDALTGGGGDDRIYGGGEDDSIAGGGGMDTVNGGKGNDTIDGGAGGDILNGGQGDDLFVYTGVTDSGVTDPDRDTIKNFDKYGDDMIDLALIDADVNTGGDQAFTLIGEAAFSGTAGELRFDANLMQADVDGDGLADFEIALNTNAVGADDFFL